MVQRSTQRFHPSWPTGHRFFPKSPESMDGKAHSLSNRDPLTKRKNRTLRRLPRIIRPKNAPGLRLRLVLCGDWHGTRRLPCCAGFSLADQDSHSHPRGDFAPYRALFSVSCAHPEIVRKAMPLSLRWKFIQLAAAICLCPRQVRRTMTAKRLSSVKLRRIGSHQANGWAQELWGELIRHRTGNDRIACPYSPETSAIARN